MNANQTVEPHDLPGTLVNTQPKKKGRDKAFKAKEKQLSIDSLIRNNCNRRKAADELGIKYTTFLRKLKDYGIDPNKICP